MKSNFGKIVLRGVMAFALAMCVGLGWSAENSLAGEKTTSQRIAPFIAAIKSAPDPGTAAASYTRGANIDSDSVELQNAYMEQMLKFGLPKLAYHPAVILTSLDPKNGVAWGVVGYVKGKKGDLGGAFSATVRGAGLDPDNDSILNNAGQLLAWYEHTITVTDVPDAVKRTIDHMKKKWEEKKAFSASYDRIIKAFSKQVEMDKELSKKIARQEASILAIQRNVLQVDAELRNMQEEISTKQMAARFLMSSLLYGNSYSMLSPYPYYDPYPYPHPYPPRPWPPGPPWPPCPPPPGPCPPPPPAPFMSGSSSSMSVGMPFFPPFGGSSMSFGGSWGNFAMSGRIGGGYYPFNRYPSFTSGYSMFPYPSISYPVMTPFMQYNPELMGEISQAGKEIRKLRTSAAKVQAQGNSLAVDMKGKQEKLKKLNTELAAIDNLLKRNIRWDPPMVDGVLTPAREHYVMKPAKGEVPVDPKSESRRLYKLVVLYLNYGALDKAGKFAAELKKKYPQTPEAKQIDSLIDKKLSTQAGKIE